MDEDGDILVIGAGVAGLASALSLLERGRSVRVVDAGRVGGGSSHGNCGTLTPSHAGPLPAAQVSGTPSCFSPVEHKWNFLRDLEVLLESRRNADPATSYTASLYARGTKRIAQKVGEEGVETALAATVHDREELRNEAADLVYHLLVLLADADLELADVIDVLRARHASREKAAEAK